MSLQAIFFKFVIGDEWMWRQRSIVYAPSHKIKYIPIGQTDDIFFNFGHGRLPLFILQVIKGEDLVDWGNHISKNVISWYYVRECSISINYHKLILIFIVPKNSVNSICDKF